MLRVNSLPKHFTTFEDKWNADRPFRVAAVLGGTLLALTPDVAVNVGNLADAVETTIHRAGNDVADYQAGRIIGTTNMREMFGDMSPVAETPSSGLPANAVPYQFDPNAYKRVS